MLEYFAVHFLTCLSLCYVLVVTAEQPPVLRYSVHIATRSNESYLCSDPGVLTGSMEGHTDAVWGLSIHSQRLQLLSCSADCTVKLWSPTSKVPLLSTYVSEQGILLN
jgi:WD40 repeat protein